jgi:Galactosyltransferase
MKTDDDVFVNIFTVMQHLFDLEHRLSAPTVEATMTSPHSTVDSRLHRRRTPSAVPLVGSSTANARSPGLIVCMRWKHPPVARRGKWAVTRSEFAEATYPSYCSGVGFIMTPDVPGHLLRQAVASLLPDAAPFWIDDAYLTGLLVRDLNGTVRLADMSRAFCKADKMAVLYGHPDEWYKYAFTHVGGLDSTGNSNARLYEATWNRLLALAIDRSTTSSTEIPRPRIVRPGRLADRYRSYRRILHALRAKRKAHDARLTKP